MLHLQSLRWTGKWRRGIRQGWQDLVSLRRRNLRVPKWSKMYKICSIDLPRATPFVVNPSQPKMPVTTGIVARPPKTAPVIPAANFVSHENFIKIVIRGNDCSKCCSLKSSYDVWWRKREIILDMCECETKVATLNTGDEEWSFLYIGLLIIRFFLST